MSWLEETADQTDKPVDDKWLKIPSPEIIGKTSEVKFRILEEEPEDAWRHWLDNRVYGCLGFDSCPVCRVRNAALKVDKEAAQKQYRTDHRFFFNVLHDGKVKVYGFGPGVSRQLKTFSTKYGDLRDYDVTIQRRRIGKLPMNVEDTVIYEPPTPLSEDQKLTAETRYDLTPFVTPASREDLAQIAQGVQPTRPDEGEREESPKALSNTKATKADMLLLKALIEAKGFKLEHFGLSDGEELDKAVIDKLIDDLKMTTSVANLTT